MPERAEPADSSHVWAGIGRDCLACPICPLWPFVRKACWENFCLRCSNSFPLPFFVTFFPFYVDRLREKFKCMVLSATAAWTLVFGTNPTGMDWVDLWVSIELIELFFGSRGKHFLPPTPVVWTKSPAPSAPTLLGAPSFCFPSVFFNSCWKSVEKSFFFCSRAVFLQGSVLNPTGLRTKTAEQKTQWMHSKWNKHNLGLCGWNGTFFFLCLKFDSATLIFFILKWLSFCVTLNSPQFFRPTVFPQTRKAGTAAVRFS